MKNKIIELILKKSSTNNDRLIGVEIENIVYTKSGNRIPVNPSKYFSALYIVDGFQFFNFGLIKYAV